MSVAATYAEALFQAAVDGQAVDQVVNDLDQVRESLSPTGEIARVLFNPQVDSSAKKTAISGLAGTAHPLTVNLLRVLVDRGRLEELPAIADAFAERVAEASGQIAVEVTTAIPLDADLREQVAVRISEQTGRTPQITERVDPDIIGGLVVRVGGVVTDASIRGRLDGLRRTISGV